MANPKLLITIDTEEDEWGAYDLPQYRVSNIARLVQLQAMFEEYGVRPTYMITRPVAEDRAAIGVLAPILERGGCEIGAHCHPWNTPPYVEARTPANSMLCNLPADLQLRKLDYLIGTIRKHYGVEPTSFRSGRWGFSTAVARNVAALGLKVDSSITPFMSWTAYGGPDFDRPYLERYPLSLDDLSVRDESSPLIEIPVTAGLHGSMLGPRLATYRMLSRAPFTWVKGRSIADRVGLLSMTWLCPEMSSTTSMIALSEQLLGQGVSILNLMFHSGTLTPGLTPFVRTEEAEARFLRRIRSYLDYCRMKGIGSATLTEAALW